MIRKLLLLLLSLAVGTAAHAQSGRTFYIDHVLGNNANVGTKASPWQSHPSMQANSTCRSNNNVPSTYTHQAGDHFIFKGGVTWPAACFGMFPPSGGSSSSNYDYYGVDQTWFNGGSWTRPLFDLNFTAPSGDSVMDFNSATMDFVMVDNIEITHQNIDIVCGSTGGFGAEAAITFLNNNPVNAPPTFTVVKNVYIHDWVTSYTGSPACTPGSPGINYSDGSIFGATLVDNATISDQNGWYGSPGHSIHFGGAVQWVAPGNTSEVRNSHFSYLMAGCFNQSSCHDNEFDHFDSSVGLTIDPNIVIHSQVIETDGGAPMNAYNNYVHDNGQPSNMGIVVYMCGKGAFYNNVMTNNNTSGNGHLVIGDSTVSGRFCGNNPGNSGDVISIYNNTFDCSNSPYCFATDSKGTLPGTVNLKNNIFITNSSNALSIVSSITTFNNTNNYKESPSGMTTSEAGTYGFVQGNKYSPSSSDPNTVGQGVNLTSSCSGNLAAICQDTSGAPWFGGSYKNRPTGSTAWDIGAFQGTGGGGGGSGPPIVSISSPVAGNQNGTVTFALTATPQGTATISSCQLTIDGFPFGAAVSSPPYQLSWDTTTASNQAHHLSLSSNPSICTDSNAHTGLASDIVVTPNNSLPNAFVDNANWSTFQTFTPQTSGTQIYTVTITPNTRSATSDNVVCFSQTQATSYSSCSAIIRFNDNGGGDGTLGTIDIYDGNLPGYHAAITVTYAALTAYSFSVSINMAAQTYSVTETSPVNQVLASNYAFRTAATSLGYFNAQAGYDSTPDTIKVANFQIAGSSTLSFSQPSINFGPVSSGSSATQTESVTVTGSNVTFTGATVTPSPFTLNSDTCNGNTVSSCSSVVKFAPVSVANFTGTLCYTDNATGSPQCINLTGSGVAATPATVTLSTNASNPVTSINFNSWLIFNPSGPTATITGTVLNGPATISVSITGGDAADFKITSDGCTASVSSQCQETFQFTPHRFGIETTTAAFAISGQATQNVTLVATSVVSTQIIAVPF